MLRKRSLDKSIREAISQGEENHRLITRLEPWCEHLKVMIHSRGIVAQQTGLPIGMLSVNCKHATEGGMQGGNFKPIAAYFIQSNCRDCPHQKELNPNNLGRDFLRVEAEVREEEAKPGPASPARERLRSLVSADLSRALETAPTTEQSVLEWVARLENQKESAVAAETLVKVAEVAPDLFSSVAIGVVAEFMGDLSCGRDCTRVLRILGSKSIGQTPVVIEAALKQLHAPICDDEVLELLADYYANTEKLPNLGTVSRVFEIHGWRSIGIGITSKPEANPGQIRLLTIVARRDGRLVADAANRLLSSLTDRHHAAVAVTLRELVPMCAAIGLDVLDGLLGALRQGHEDHGEIDSDLCEAIAEVFMFFPAECQEWFAREVPKVDAETQDAAFKTYERLWRAAEYGEKTAARTTRARAVLPQVIDALLPALTQPEIGLEARGEAAETLRYLADDFPGLLKDRLDGLLGALALVVQEHLTFNRANPGGDPQLPGFPRSEHASYDRIVGRIVASLEKMADFAPTETLRGAEQLFNGLSSKDDAQAVTKRRLLQVAAKLTKDDATALAIIPWIYRAMMDPDSVLVRAEAINVIGELLYRSNDLVPENMREMLLVYVGDRYVWVAYSAIKATRRLEPDDLTEAKRILVGMLNLYSHYTMQRGYVYERSEVCEAIIGLCRKYPDFFAYGLGILVKEVGNADEHDAKKGLQTWLYALDSFPESRSLFIGELLRHLVRHPLDPDDIHHGSDIYQCLLELYDASKKEIVANLAAFPPAIAAAGKVHPFGPLQLIAILLHHEQFEAAAKAADSVAATLPPGQFQKMQHDELLLLQAAALAEAQVTAGKTKDAARLLSAEKTRLERYEKKEEPHKPDTFVQAFSLANKVSDRVK